MSKERLYADLRRRILTLDLVEVDHRHSLLAALLDVPGDRVGGGGEGRLEVLRSGGADEQKHQREAERSPAAGTGPP